MRKIISYDRVSFTFVFFRMYRRGFVINEKPGMIISIFYTRDIQNLKLQDPSGLKF
jgi:hypothetical protein